MKKTITILMLFVVTTLTQAQKLTDLKLDSTIFWFEYESNGEIMQEIICNVKKDGIVNLFGSRSKYNVLFTMLPEYWFNELWYLKNYGYSVYYYRDIKIYTTDKFNEKTYYDKYEFYNFYEKLDSVTKHKLSEYACNSELSIINRRLSSIRLPSYFLQKKHEKYDCFSILEYRYRRGLYLFYEPKINCFLYGWCDKKNEQHLIN